MEWIKIVGMVLVCVVLVSILRQYNPVYGVLAGVVCCVGVFLAAMGAMLPVVQYLTEITQRLSGADVLPVLKAMGILILGQIARDVCKDAGQTALAGQVELAARALVLFAALPLFRQLLSLISGLLA